MAEENKQQQGPEQKLFGKWSYDEVQITDPCFKDYISITQQKVKVLVPHTSGRYTIKRFRKVNCPIVERLVNALMFHGKNSGKKCLAIRVVKHAFEIIGLMTGRNPLEVYVGALQKAGAREDSTRIGAGGVVRKQAVDVSPLRRVNQAIFLITMGARQTAFKNNKTVAEVLADEIINCEKENPQCFSIRKKDEIEKIAKTNR